MDKKILAALTQYLGSEEAAIAQYDVMVAEQIANDVQFELDRYKQERKTKYDALNQLELISDDAINGTTTHKDAILAIKAEFPKPV